MASVTWVKTRIHDASQAILLSMVIIMAGWSLASIIPHTRSCSDFLSQNAAFGIISMALAVMGAISLNLTSLPIRAISLVCMSVMTGLIALAYLTQARYTMDCIVYVVLTMQSWWAIATLPVSEIGRGRNAD